MHQKQVSPIKILISILLFIVSGILSSYLYYRLNDRGGAILPGLFYTSTTVLIFLLAGVKLKIGKVVIYYVLMNITYLVTLFLTFLSSYFGFLAGIITAGTGAVLTFLLTQKFIITFRFKKTTLFVLGGLAFLITDILYFTSSSLFEKVPLEQIFEADVSPGTLFLEVFVFWHSIVGTKLILAIREADLT